MVHHIIGQQISTKAQQIIWLRLMSDKEAVEALSSLKGVGVWTAEMILLFCMQRPDILSFGDLAIQRGMRMVYHHRKIDKKLLKIPQAAVPLRQHRKLVFLGGIGRRC